jgi:hypothetical protein
LPDQSSPINVGHAISLKQYSRPMSVNQSRKSISSTNLPNRFWIVLYSFESRLLFTSEETEYAQFRTLAKPDFAYTGKTAQDDAHARVMEVGLLLFCRVFGFGFSKDKQNLIDATRNTFRQLELFEPR